MHLISLQSCTLGLTPLGHSGKLGHFILLFGAFLSASMTLNCHSTLAPGDLQPLKVIKVKFHIAFHGDSQKLPECPISESKSHGS